MHLHRSVYYQIQGTKFVASLYICEITRRICHFVLCLAHVSRVFCTDSPELQQDEPPKVTLRFHRMSLFLKQLVILQEDLCVYSLWSFATTGRDWGSLFFNFFFVITHSLCLFVRHQRFDLFVFELSAFLIFSYLI